jgi:hypothetical protein
MAVFAATEYVITVGGTDLSDHIAQVDMPVEYADLDTTTFASGGARERIGGLEDGSITIRFLQDFAASEVDATLWPLRNTKTSVVVKPRNAAVSATNPSYTGTYLVNQLTPISGSVGELATMNVTWPKSGALVRATS